MSGSAAKEITATLDLSISKVESIVGNMKNRIESLVVNGDRKVSSGGMTAQRCGEVLGEIVENVTKVGSMVGEISVATGEQARGIAEINRSMNQLDEIAHRNDAASQQAAEAAVNLQDEVGHLNALIFELDRTVHGNADGASAKRFAA